MKTRSSQKEANQHLKGWFSPIKRPGYLPRSFYMKLEVIRHDDVPMYQRSRRVSSCRHTAIKSLNSSISISSSSARISRQTLGEGGGIYDIVETIYSITHLWRTGSNSGSLGSGIAFKLISPVNGWDTCTGDIE
jgi:hypothetical protein